MICNLIANMKKSKHNLIKNYCICYKKNNLMRAIGIFHLKNREEALMQIKDKKERRNLEL